MPLLTRLTQLTAASALLFQPKTVGSFPEAPQLDVSSDAQVIPDFSEAQQAYQTSLYTWTQDPTKQASAEQPPAEVVAYCTSGSIFQLSCVPDYKSDYGYILLGQALKTKFVAPQNEDGRYPIVVGSISQNLTRVDKMFEVLKWLALNGDFQFAMDGAVRGDYLEYRYFGSGFDPNQPNYRAILGLPDPRHFIYQRFLFAAAESYLRKYTSVDPGPLLDYVRASVENNNLRDAFETERLYMNRLAAATNQSDIFSLSKLFDVIADPILANSSKLFPFSDSDREHHLPKLDTLDGNARLGIHLIKPALSTQPGARALSLFYIMFYSRLHEMIKPKQVNTTDDRNRTVNFAMLTKSAETLERFNPRQYANYNERVDELLNTLMAPFKDPNVVFQNISSKVQHLLNSSRGYDEISWKETLGRLTPSKPVLLGLAPDRVTVTSPFYSYLFQNNKVQVMPNQ